MHLRHLSALRGFLAPHLRQTCRNSLRFWAICFLVASAMGILKSREARWDATISFQERYGQPRLWRKRTGTCAGVMATFTPAPVRALIFESAVP